MSSVVRIVAPRLAEIGFRVRRSAAPDGSDAINGVPGWVLRCRDDGFAAGSVALAVLASSSDRCAVLALRKGEIRALMISGHLEAAASEVRRLGSGNQSLSSTVSRVLARAEGQVATFSCGGEPGVAVPLDSWITFMLAWRISSTARERTDARVPNAEGSEVGRWRAHDYSAVREAFVLAEVEEEIRTRGHPLIRSSAGLALSSPEGLEAGDIGPAVDVPATRGRGRPGRPRGSAGKGRRA